MAPAAAFADVRASAVGCSTMVPQYTAMHPTQVREPFHRLGSGYEEKVDGWRILAWGPLSRIPGPGTAGARVRVSIPVQVATRTPGHHAASVGASMSSRGRGRHGAV